VSTQWTADSDTVTADSPTYTADGGGGSSTQYPSVPALPGVPVLARLQTAAQVAAGASVSGQSASLATLLGLPQGVTFGTDALYDGLDLTPL
jgi:hypothetical protein